MSLVPIDDSNYLSLYSNNHFSSMSNPIVPSFSPKTECPLDPKNDLLPPGYTSPLIDMKFGPPEQTIKRYFSITVEDINSFHKEKIKKWIKVYEKVLGNCFRKIREHVLRDQKFCFFLIPEYLPGFPLFNITHCSCFIIKKLNQAGFQTKFIPPNIVYIFWDIDVSIENKVDKVDNKRLIENKDIHYITLEKEIPDDVIQPRISNNIKYSYKQPEQFLF